MAGNCKAGRPRGRKKISKIEVSIEPSIKEEFMSLLSDEGKTASGQICDWIRAYIKKHKTEEF
jgi:hypothetical protein